MSDVKIDEDFIGAGGLQGVGSKGYYRFSMCEKSDIFLIAFSGANVPKGKFNYTNAFGFLNFNVIYLNDNLDGYYQNGISGIGNDLTSTIDNLRSMIYSHCSSPRIFTFGCSMGGYGAILYGALLGAEAVLSFGPAVPSYSGFLKGKAYYQDCLERFKQLVPVLRGVASDCFIYYGDRSLVDVCSYAFLKELGFNNSKIYKKTCHALVYTVSQRESLVSMVARFVLSRDDFYIPIDGIGEYDNLNIPSIVMQIADEYFSSSTSVGVSSDCIELNCEAAGSFFSACSEIRLKSDITLAKRFFFKSLDYSVNSKTLSLIWKRLNSAECEIVFFALDKLLANNPTLFGYDVGEKKIIAKIYSSLYEKYYLCDSARANEYLDGYLDGFNGASIRGWAFKDIKSTLVISLFINEVFLGNFNASNFRGDLKAKDKGNGGNCAFFSDFDLSRLLGVASGDSPIRLHALDSKFGKIKNSGMYVKRPLILSSLDRNYGGILSGWIANYTYPNVNIPLKLYLNGEYLFDFYADIDRPDVLQNGFCMAKGFRIDLNSVCDISERNMIDIVYADRIDVYSKLILSGSIL